MLQVFAFRCISNMCISLSNGRQKRILQSQKLYCWGICGNLCGPTVTALVYLLHAKFKSKFENQVNPSRRCFAQSCRHLTTISFPEYVHSSTSNKPDRSDILITKHFYLSLQLLNPFNHRSLPTPTETMKSQKCQKVNCVQQQQDFSP